MGNLGFQELLVLVIIIGVIILIVKAATKNSNSPILAKNLSNSSSQSMVVVKEGKSVTTAFLLAFFFGPLGLLYASVTGGLVMIVVSLIVGVVTLGVGLLVTWIICILWAVSAAGNSKKDTMILTHNTAPPESNYHSPIQETPRVDKESLLNQLSQLHALKEKNVLTEEIYERERQSILDRLNKL